jgi:hypothetical protein
VLRAEKARPPAGSGPGRNGLAVTVLGCAAALAPAVLASFTNTPANEAISLINGSAAQAYPIVDYEYAS